MTARPHYYRRTQASRMSDAERDARIERVAKWAVGAAIAALIVAGYWLAIEAGIAAGRAGL